MSFLTRLLGYLAVALCALGTSINLHLFWVTGAFSSLVLAAMCAVGIWAWWPRS